MKKWLAIVLILLSRAFTWKEKNIAYNFSREIFTLWSIFRYCMEGLLAYFLGKQGVLGTILLPEMLFLYFSLPIQHFEP